MGNIITVMMAGAILGFAICYIRKEKKRGVKCIGCPAGCSCSISSKGSSLEKSITCNHDHTYKNHRILS